MVEGTSSRGNAEGRLYRRKKEMESFKGYLEVECNIFDIFNL